MEPLTSLSLAANILQFIEFGCKLFLTTREIYATGNTTEHAHLESITDNLREISDRLKSPDELQLSNDVPGEKQLREIAAECYVVATQLSDALKMLKSKNNHGKKWESFVQALSLLWKEKGRVNAMKEKLESLRLELITNIAIIIK